MSQHIIPAESQVITLPAAVNRPLTIEQLQVIDLPTELSGEFGTNRARGKCQIKATNDLQAVATWLQEFSVSPATHRAYRKEAERFVNWALLIARKPLSSIELEDLRDFEAFLANPMPKDFWIATRKEQQRALRGTPNWRPFEKPVPKSGIARAAVVLNALFNYLTAVDYLAGNPYAARRLKAKKAGSQAAARRKSALNAAPYLPMSTLKALFQVLEDDIAALPQDDRVQRAKLERWLFLTRFLANTGLRREELATAVMSDVFSIERGGMRSWYMHVVGKGGVARDIPFIEKAREALTRYLQHYDLPVQYIDNQTPILLPLSGRANVGNELNSQTVYTATKAALEYAAARLKESSPDDATLLGRATPHKFRHAFATVLSEVHGLSIAAIQDVLGHQSIETTALYTHSDKEQTYQAIKNAGI